MGSVGFGETLTQHQHLCSACGRDRDGCGRDRDGCGF